MIVVFYNYLFYSISIFFVCCFNYFFRRLNSIVGFSIKKFCSFMEL